MPDAVSHLTFIGFQKPHEIEAPSSLVARTILVGLGGTALIAGALIQLKILLPHLSGLASHVGWLGIGVGIPSVLVGFCVKKVQGKKDEAEHLLSVQNENSTIDMQSLSHENLGKIAIHELTKDTFNWEQLTKDQVQAILADPPETRELLRDSRMREILTQLESHVLKTIFPHLTGPQLLEIPSRHYKEIDCQRITSEQVREITLQDLKTTHDEKNLVLLFEHLDIQTINTLIDHIDQGCLRYLPIKHIQNEDLNLSQLSEEKLKGVFYQNPENLLDKDPETTKKYNSIPISQANKILHKLPKDRLQRFLYLRAKEPSLDLSHLSREVLDDLFNNSAPVPMETLNNFHPNVIATFHNKASPKLIARLQRSNI